jgi:hypothetical protein
MTTVFDPHLALRTFNAHEVSFGELKILAAIKEEREKLS